MKSRKGKETL